MPGEARRRGWRPQEHRGCGCGCGGAVLVLTLGIALSLFNAVAAVGLSFRIPFTPASFTVAGSIGAKWAVEDALPGYDKDRLGGNQNFINHSQTLTIGPAEGVALVVLGEQKGAPPVDLHLVLR